MTSDPFSFAFADMMNDQLIWEQFSGQRDRYAKPQYNSPLVFQCRLQRKNKIVRNKDGEQVVSSAQACVVGNPPVGPEDRITLSDSVQPVILSIGRSQDEHGVDATAVIYFL